MPGGALRMMLSRHSAFYMPLICTVGAGFLKEEGLAGSLATHPPAGRPARSLLMNGEVDILQSSVGSSFVLLERGERNLPVHFAQINQRDGFFLVGRRPDPSFHWKKLEGAALVAEPAGQPLFMLKYCAQRNGVEWSRIHVIDAGHTSQLEAAFRCGTGDYVHEQGPEPQQLEREGLGYVVASVGEAMPPVCFSTLMASRSFLKTDAAKAFMRAFRKAREWASQGPAAEIACATTRFFPKYGTEVLAEAIARYQKLGCWDGDAGISPEGFEQALEVFAFNGQISRRYAYHEVAVPPPDLM